MGTTARAIHGEDRQFDALKSERDRFVALAFCAADALFELDPAFRITFAAGAVTTITGAHTDGVIGRTFLDLVDHLDRPLVEEYLRGIQKGTRLAPLSIRMAHRTAAVPEVTVAGYHLPELSNCYFFALKIGKPKAHEPPAHDDADDDRDNAHILKGELFAEEAAARLREARDRGEHMNLTMVRMPALPHLYSRMGEEAAGALKKTIRATLQVSAGAEELVGEFDDQNFGVVHDDGVDIAELSARIERHAKSADPSGEGVAVATGTADGETFDLTEENAVRALVHTINEFCDTQVDELSHESLTGKLTSLAETASNRLTEFRTIITSEMFDAAFQPIVQTRNRLLHHYEALARFTGGSDQSPYELITFAENTGLITSFDFAMCKKIIRTIKNFREEGRAVKVAVNLSGRTITSARFHDEFERLLKAYGSIRRQLLLEITESAQIHDLEGANRAIQSLRRSGHKVCLDDFGAGAAAFRYLHMLDVDFVKIDGHYVEQSVGRPKDRAFLRAIAGLCGELGVQTIAERVEDDQTLDILIECGVGFAQGYLFGRPNTDIRSFK